MMKSEKKSVRLNPEQRLQKMICSTKSTGNAKVDMVAAKVLGEAFRHRESVAAVKGGYSVSMKNGVVATVKGAPSKNGTTQRYTMKIGKLEIPGSFASKCYKVCEKALKPKAVRGANFDQSEVDSVAALLGI